MSAHLYIFYPSGCEKNCLNIENNHKFMISALKYILYIYASRTGGRPSDIANMKNGFPKSPSHIYNRWCKTFFGEGRRKIERMCVFAETSLYVCFIILWGLSISRKIFYCLLLCASHKIYIYSIFEKLFDDVDLWLLELKIKSISYVGVCVCEFRRQRLLQFSVIR